MSPENHEVANRIVEPLTAREVEILELYAAGFNNPEVAAQLFLAESTIQVVRPPNLRETGSQRARFCCERGLPAGAPGAEAYL